MFFIKYIVYKKIKKIKRNEKWVGCFLQPTHLLIQTTKTENTRIPNQLCYWDNMNRLSLNLF